MPEKREITVYRFEELSPKAKDKARAEYAEIQDYPWAEEALKSIAALAEHFNGRIARYEINWQSGYGPSFMFFDMGEMGRVEILEKLKVLGAYDPKTLKGLGDCRLTGYCADKSAIDGFRRAFIRDKETDLEKLMQAAFKTWLEVCQRDCDYLYSDEGLKETADANEWRFLKNGGMAPL